MKKTCSKCGIEKDASEFHRNKNYKDGFLSRCNERKREYYHENKEQNKGDRKEYYELNKEKIIDKSKEYYEANKEEIRIKKKEYTQKNKDLIKHQRKKKYEKNKDEIKEKSRQYYHQNVESVNERSSKYRKENKEKLGEYNKEYRKANRAILNQKKKEWNIAKGIFETYSIKLTPDEKPVTDDEGFLKVNCTYCGRHYYPTNLEVLNRISALEGKRQGEQRLYCSETCKRACPVYKRILWPAGYKPATSREVQPQLRQMRLALDEYECKKCGVSIEDAELHCHHYTGTVQNPIESADVDNTVTVCKKCHKWVHTQEGCRYFELRCK
jgi:hypothetical protein